MIRGTLGMGLQNQRLAAAGAPAGPVLTTLPVTPTARWSPQFSTVATSGGRVTSASDLQGLAAATEGAAGLGPVAMTDATGRKFWRFEGTEWLTVAKTLSHNVRDMSVFFVGRSHRSSAAFTVYSAGINADTAVNTNSAALSAVITAGAGHWWTAHGASGGSIAGKEAQLLTGSQMQVAGMCSRATAQGGRRVMVNDQGGNTTQNSTASLGITGAEIGRYSWNATALGVFDLYELAVYNTGLTDAQADSVMAALMAGFGIVPIVNQLILEGDSITQGTGTVTPGISAAMLLTEPGSNLIPANWRVSNRGLSGAKCSDLVVRRDAASGWATWTLPGKNVVAFEIGRNDWGVNTEAQEYSEVVALINTPSTGYLQRGWTVRVMANIATAPTFQAKVVPFRALLRNSTFLTDTLSNTGQAFEGKVSVIGTDLITHAGATIFEDSTDAGNVTYYQGDSTHPTPLGALLRVNGGTTPQHGIAYGLTA